VPFDRPQEQVPLAPLTTLGLGGHARWFARATRVEHVLAAHGWAPAHGLPLFVLGGGSNLVVSDDGFDGLVLQIAITGIKAALRGEDMLVSAGAGEAWDGLVEFAVTRGLAGIECLSGIPGTVGGTPIQNVGAYGQEVASVIEWVDTVDRVKQGTVRLSRSDCGFGYRTSRFKQQDAGRFIVCEVAFRLRPGASPTVTYPDIIDYLSKHSSGSPDVRAVREAVLNVRRRKGMVIDAADPDTRSVGSFFMNPIVNRVTFERIATTVQGDGDKPGPRVPHFMMDNDSVKIPAAWLIEQSGFARGHLDGRVGLSTKHPLAIVNRGGATARDVIRLARSIKRAVIDRFGVALRPEPVFVGFADDPDVAYLRT
jgi:UDP-N-acetylmuramate dehydrogenase